METLTAFHLVQHIPHTAPYISAGAYTHLNVRLRLCAGRGLGLTTPVQRYAVSSESSESSMPTQA
ncbi:hypothetical protein BAUCODRAFT_330983 [Baudoinia panamericana UAMH 10762]|uniref:Uncharacterized protein n=1 Tax=Baudoinia panamericana (strain UAMH 10762) TaxID=717646 RepID=M2MWD0_BAUPA|nr:uncharacterized protein BAUCODRAFT_330983 [Baudoinia panamericana UAMH 10762]EMC90889.1 hypothetical protein BAUCODRAFT_330983 [Baudoinia panamericana UAMH 10762]